MVKLIGVISQMMIGVGSCDAAQFVCAAGSCGEEAAGGTEVDGDLGLRMTWSSVCGSVAL